MPSACARRAASMSQTLSPTTVDVSIATSSLRRRRDEEIGIGFRVAHFVARHDRHAVEIDAERFEHGPRRFHAPARRDRPRNARVGQMRDELASAGQRADRPRAPAVGLRMHATQTLAARGVDLVAALAQEDVRHQATAHADLAMDAPDRERDAFAFERFLPGEHMLIDAVDERAIEIEKKCGVRDAHAGTRRGKGLRHGNRSRTAGRDDGLRSVRA